MARVAANERYTEACIDSGAGPCILHSKWVDEMKLKKVSWLGLPVKFFDEIKSPTEAWNIAVKLARRSAFVHAAIVHSKQFDENILLGNDLLDVLKPNLDFRTEKMYFLDRGPCSRCLENGGNQNFTNEIYSKKVITNQINSKRSNIQLVTEVKTVLKKMRRSQGSQLYHLKRRD